MGGRHFRRLRQYGGALIRLPTVADRPSELRWEGRTYEVPKCAKDRCEAFQQATERRERMLWDGPGLFLLLLGWAFGMLLLYVVLTVGIFPRPASPSLRILRGLLVLGYCWLLPVCLRRLYAALSRRWEGSSTQYRLVILKAEQRLLEGARIRSEEGPER